MAERVAYLMILFDIFAHRPSRLLCSRTNRLWTRTSIPGHLWTILVNLTYPQLYHSLLHTITAETAFPHPPVIGGTPLCCSTSRQTIDISSNAISRNRQAEYEVYGAVLSHTLWEPVADLLPSSAWQRGRGRLCLGSWQNEARTYLTLELPYRNIEYNQVYTLGIWPTMKVISCTRQL